MEFTIAFDLSGYNLSKEYAMAENAIETVRRNEKRGKKEPCIRLCMSSSNTRFELDEFGKRFDLVVEDFPLYTSTLEQFLEKCRILGEMGCTHLMIHGDVKVMAYANELPIKTFMKEKQLKLEFVPIGDLVYNRTRGYYMERNACLVFGDIIEVS